MGDREEPVSILLVDDSAEKLMTLGVILADLGETLVEARSGREALRCLLNQEFAVILLDVNMPGMDGFETASLIRQRKSSEKTPIIFITAFADDTHVTQGYSLGAVDYIVAPVVPEILKSKVAVFVDLFRKTQQVQRQAKSLTRRADQLHRLTEASLAINSALSLDEILRLVTETARDLLGASEAITLATLDADLSRVRSSFSVAEPSAAAQERLTAAGAALSRALANYTRPVRTRAAELARDVDQLLPDLALDPPPTDEAWLSGPLSGRDGRSLGWVHLACPSGDFEGEDAAILTQLSQMASIAIENTLASEAREANRLKDEFLATLSHELRTPLTAIMGWTRILRTTPYDAERSSHGLEVIERNVQAQAKLIDDLLDVSRIIAGKLRLSLRPMAIVPAVETAVEGMRPAAEAKGVELHLSIDPSIERGERIDGDADRLQQVGWNLVSNAIKFTPAGGRIDVHLRRSGDRFEIRVTDTGKGISPSFLRHVFDRFRQADSTTTRSQGGLGIGLAIVSHIVELHGGTVAAESHGLGQGAVFAVTLPARSGPEESVAALAVAADGSDRSDGSDGDNGAGTDLSPWKLLLVDDEADACEVLSEVLRSFDARVATAGSLEQALSRFEEDAPDVLISDIAMPGGDGYELLRRVRALPKERGGEVPAIALTAYAREEDRLRSLAAGFAEHLAKPVEPLRLVAAIATLALRASRADGEGQPAEAEPAERERRQVLVVEDDEDSREALKTLLELSGYSVHVAGSGTEGVEKALALRPHIAVVDIGLPEIDGNEVARRIREALGSNSIFLVALTGYANESDMQRTKEAGFNAHLAKPLELTALKRLLQGVGVEGPG